MPTLERIYTPKFFQDDEIFIRIIVAGICRSDIKEIEKSRLIRNDFGHEIAGYVVWSNPNFPFSVGDLVCFDPHVDIVRSSGFSEYMIARGEPESLAKAFPKGPTGLPEERMVFCEPLACANHSVHKLREFLHTTRFDGLKIGIVGAGNAGTLIGLLIKYLGGDITIINRGPSRLLFLRERKIFSNSELTLMT